MTRKVEGENSEDLLSGLTGKVGGAEELLALAKSMSNQLGEDDVGNETSDNPTNSKRGTREGKTPSDWEENFSSTEMIDDPVRMYLKEMGNVDLLSRQGEIDIAKRSRKEVQTVL